MDAPRLTVRTRSILAMAMALALAAVALTAAWIGYRYATDRYTVTTEDNGEAVAKVVTAAFSRASALRVGTISGIIQSTASDSRAFGLLQSNQVVKLPFSVDYFVDASRLSDRDIAWSTDTGTLTIDAPAIAVAKPNVDFAGRTLVQTGGLLVTRSAAEALTHKVAGNAARVATAEANKPERLALARDNARRALADLLVAPLKAADVPVRQVVVTFPDERAADRRRWDVSRDWRKVAAEGKAAR